MKRSFAIIAMFAMALSFTLCCCDASLAPKTFTMKDDVTYNVYVCGAVSNEGYCAVNAGATYNNAITQVGIVEQTVFPSFGELFIDSDTVILVDYFENGKQYSPVNVNGEFVMRKYPIENISYDVIVDIADYIAANGLITDKKILKDILGDRYEGVHYKFFVDKENYEAVS